MTTTTEKNTRSAALGQYCRWVYRRFQRLEVVELAESPDLADPIGLRQVYVPLRLAEQDLADEEIGKGIEPAKEELPGSDAFELLVEEPFVALSGRPGSGKTTLVHALVVALAGARPSRLRKALGAVPVPLILRRFDDLERIHTLGDLIAAWWPENEAQAAEDGLPLDRERLTRMLFPADPEDLTELPVLLLFDGIDEVGGPKTRQKLLDLAFEARQRGYRVLVTGRPAGFIDLRGPSPEAFEVMSEALVAMPVEGAARPLVLHHLQPFAWPQVGEFIRRWYGLRDEWARDAERGIARFLEHLEEPSRRPMLTLARRPIFLTLMALVNCTQNQMPEGRAILYRQIVDLYLERQERFRQRKGFTDAEDHAIPPWPAAETRRVLARVAAISQERGSAAQAKLRGPADTEQRRYRWRREELESTVGEVLGGRFSVLRPADAATLVAFFLHPAGLLVEPAEGEVQFAHLSFQEYLCAVDLYERADVAGEGREPYLRRELFEHLQRPGWDEVGLLVLCIRSENSRREGHLGLLRWLDPADPHQATLYVSAVSGKELFFTADERRERLPLAMLCALLHPDRQLGTLLRRRESLAGSGLGWLVRLLEAPSDEALWELLAALAEGHCQEKDLARASQRWRKPPDDESWAVSFDATEARAAALLRLVGTAGWGLANDPLQPLAEPQLEAALARWLESRAPTADPAVLWHRRDDGLPGPTDAGYELDTLLPDRGPLWREALRRVPLDAWVLQGEVFDPEPVFWYEFSQASILLALHSGQSNPPEARLAVSLYQAVLACEAAVPGGAAAEFSRSRSRSRSLSLSLSRSRSRSLSLSLSRSLSRLLPFKEATKKYLDVFIKRLEKRNESVPKQVGEALSQLGLRFAAFDTFDQQAEDPDLSNRRGLRSGEPLPAELGLFDDAGRPHRIQKRSAFVTLRRWLDDDDTILGFVFPEDLGDDLRARFVEQLAVLRSQPWAPGRFVDAVLADWPEDQSEMDVSFAAGERRLLAALEDAED